MAGRIDEIAMAWSALSGSSGKEGWQTIPVPPVGPCCLLAARRIPGDEEALLVGFASILIPPAEKLPEGRGFSVARVEPGLSEAGRVWLALSRQPSGKPDLFATMVADVLGAMDAEAAAGEQRLLRVFLGRVRAWQEFMRRGADVLGPEAEVGLVGELVFLESLIEAGIVPLVAVEAWVGPLDGIQDFILGTGAVEVKSTLSAIGFTARIGSLEQLDDSVRKPLFVAGERLSQTSTGFNLPDFVGEVRRVLRGDAPAQSLFAERLLAAGYLDAHSDRYPRRFVRAATKLVEVGEGFPRLTPGTAPKGIRKAIYEIDLDRTGGAALSAADVLKKLGAI